MRDINTFMDFAKRVPWYDATGFERRSAAFKLAYALVNLDRPDEVGLPEQYLRAEKLLLTFKDTLSFCEARDRPLNVTSEGVKEASDA